LSIAGSGDVRTRELAADDVSISIAGSGNASVQANKTLAISVAGSGDVEYGGPATITKSRLAGSGSIRQRP
jgi:Putative auto-transporter adhesin, head GIN domain